MATYEEFRTNNKKFGSHTVPAAKTIMIVKCGKCNKHRRMLKTEGKRIDRGWVCGMAKMKDLYTGMLFNCNEGESADLEEIFGKECLEKASHEEGLRVGNSPRGKSLGKAMQSAGVIDGIEMFEGDEADEVQSGAGSGSGSGVGAGAGSGAGQRSSLTFQEMYGKDSIFSYEKHGGMGEEKLRGLAEAVPKLPHEDSTSKKRDMKRLANSRELFVKAADSARDGDGTGGSKDGQIQHQLFHGKNIAIFEDDEGVGRNEKRPRDAVGGEDGDKGMAKRVKFLENLLLVKQRENEEMARKFEDFRGALRNFDPNNRENLKSLLALVAGGDGEKDGKILEGAETSEGAAGTAVEGAADEGREEKETTTIEECGTAATVATVVTENATVEGAALMEMT